MATTDADRPVSAGNAKAMAENLRGEISTGGGVCLFNGWSDLDADKAVVSVTLSDNASNYRLLDILIQTRNNSNGYFTLARVYFTPKSTKSSGCVYPYNYSGWQHASPGFSCNGTSFSLSGAMTNNPKTKIIEIIGYK